jgi:hypothetical protein
MYLHQTFLRWKCNLLKEVLHNVNTFYGENLWRNLEITVIPTKKTSSSSGIYRNTDEARNRTWPSCAECQYVMTPIEIHPFSEFPTKYFIVFLTLNSIK